MARFLPKLALPQLALPSLPKLPNLNVGERLSSLFEGIAPDRRKYEVSYFPLAHKNAEGALVYFGTFVPDLLELARSNGSKNALQDAILLPKRAYILEANGHLNEEDLRQVAAQVTREFTRMASDARKKQTNLNIYAVDRMPAQDLYFDAKSGVAQSVAGAKSGELINIYGSARPTAFQLAYVKPTVRETMIHVSLNFVGRFAALITGLGAGLAFAPAAPYLGVLIGAATYYVVTSASQYDFWEKAEDLIRNNWALSAKLLKPKQVDWSKSAKTLGMAALVGYLAFQGGLEMYAGAVNTLINFAQLPLFSAGVALSAKALLGIKTFAGILSVTAALGAFRGLMVVMHNFVGLGYSKTTITPEERNALPVDQILKQNAKNDRDYTARKNLEVNPDLQAEVDRLTHALEDAELDKVESLFELRSELTKALIQAQTPCVSKVVALKAVFDDLVAKGEISGDLEDDAAYDAAFRAVTEQLPMNMGAWTPAQVFNNLTQEQKLKAIADFKAAGQNGRFNEYKNSAEYQAYLASDRYALDSSKFKAYLQGNSFKLDEPKGDCCHSKSAPEGIASIIEGLNIIVTAPDQAAPDMLRAPEVVQFRRSNSPAIAASSTAAANVETSDELLEVPSSSPSRSRSPSRSPSPSVIRTQPSRAAKHR